MTSACVLAVSFCCGCGHGANGTSDSRNPSDSGNPPDAPPPLAITGESSGNLLEGMGVGGSRPALIVLVGQGFAADATVTVTGAPVVVGQVQIGGRGEQLAFPLTIPISPMSFTSAALTVTVSQPGSQPVSIQLGQRVSFLPELTSVAANQETLQISMGQWSQVDIAADATFDGTADEPLTLYVVSSIHMAAIHASGKSINGLNGPGGCVGGAANRPGNCLNTPMPGDGGAAASNSSAGGGGGGFGSAGHAGTATGAGAGGAAHGDADVSEFMLLGTTDFNRGAGGGGGGGSFAGNGGGGGGFVGLYAGGDISVGDIDANGGDGAPGQVGGANGGGGGGAGGAILLLSTSGSVSSGTLSVHGGKGGPALTTGGTGGDGGNGRIRIDTPNDPLPSTMPSAARGLSYLSPTQISTVEMPDVTIVGAIGTHFIVNVTGSTGTNTDPPQTLTTSPMTIHPKLTPGFNQVCIDILYLDPQTMMLTGKFSLGDRCLDMAYLVGT